MDIQDNNAVSTVDGEIDALLKKYLGDNKEAFDEIKKNILAIAQVAKESATSNFKVVDGYVAENYWKSIGAAAILGLFIGVVVSRK